MAHFQSDCYRHFPILPWNYVLYVKPRTVTIISESVVQGARLRFVLRRMAKKYPQNMSSDHRDVFAQQNLLLQLLCLSSPPFFFFAQLCEALYLSRFPFLTRPDVLLMNRCRLLIFDRGRLFQPPNGLAQFQAVQQ
jgi:hypothetical protein